MLEKENYHHLMSRNKIKINKINKIKKKKEVEEDSDDLAILAQICIKQSCLPLVIIVIEHVS